MLESVAKLVHQHPGYSIRFTGHSLGAALATLTVLDVDELVKPKNLELITFGSPRVGNRDFTIYFNSLFSGRSFRVVHDRDMVAHLPPRLVGYNHIAAEVWETEEGLTLCDSEDDAEESSSCSNSMTPFEWTTDDHLFYLGLQIAGESRAAAQ